MRTYADFARRSPIPSRADGRTHAPRNSPALVNSTLARPGGVLFHFDAEFNSMEDLIVKLRFDLGPDGMLRGEPQVLEAARFNLGTQWAVSALKGCQPYKLDPEKYQAWKEWDFTFQP